MSKKRQRCAVDNLENNSYRTISKMGFTIEEKAFFIRMLFSKRLCIGSTVPSNKFGIRVGCDLIMKLVTCNF
jgi:hypothetical protein